MRRCLRVANLLLASAATPASGSIRLEVPVPVVEGAGPCGDAGFTVTG